MYEPFDQDQHLGEPPWDPADPALIAWEQAHGHDVRIKCYPEFGCLVIEKALERQIKLLVAELRTQTGHWEHAPDGVARHDRRMPDGGCAICALLELVTSH